MSLRKPAFLICLAAATLCLAGGLGLAGQWFAVSLAVVMGIIWLPARKYPASGLGSLCLTGSLVLAVFGLLTKAQPALMICASAFALAVWDLIFLDTALEKSSVDSQTRRYERNHMQTLALALGLGLVAALLGRLVNLRLPFLVLISFAGLVLFGLDRFWGFFKNKENQ